jgi:hypothetical protein
MEAFARAGAAAHEVERHLFREVLRLGFLLLAEDFNVVVASPLWAQGAYGGLV